MPRSPLPMPPSPRPYSSTAFVIGILVAYLVGLWVGAALFTHVEARSFLRLHRCEDKTCLRPNELVGLAAAVGIQRLGQRLPFVVSETEKSIAFLHPFPEDEYHFIVVPKRDIQNIGVLTPEEESYLVDAYALIQDLVRSQKLTKYRVVTNGPGYQKVGYLHFHVMGER